MALIFLIATSSFSIATENPINNYEKIAINELRHHGNSYNGKSIRIFAIINEVYNCKFKENLGKLCLIVSDGITEESIVLNKNVMQEAHANELRKNKSKIQMDGYVKSTKIKVNGVIDILPMLIINNFEIVNKFKNGAQPIRFDWNRIKTTRKASYYFDKNSVDIEGDGYSVWLMSDYKLPQLHNNINIYNSSIEGINFSCRNMTYKNISISLFKSSSGRGELIMEENIQFGIEQPIILADEKTYFAYIELFPLCKKYSDAEAKRLSNEIKCDKWGNPKDINGNACEIH